VLLHERIYHGTYYFFRASAALVIKGGDASAKQPLTPTTVNAGEVIEVDQGTGAYGFYSRVEPTVGFGSSTFQTPGEAYGMFGRVQTGAPFATVPSTDFNHMAGLVGNFAVIGTYANNGLMAGVMGMLQHLTPCLATPLLWRSWMATPV
jgi:hypothetical protein